MRKVIEGKHGIKFCPEIIIANLYVLKIVMDVIPNIANIKAEH